ncbi:MAG TPA: trypsin-like peptidase domain-containing protein [Planctomycetota bacterium]|nr:trypsin-like peptidase domain-containing protein [Planctomycetota bacterium]
MLRPALVILTAIGVPAAQAPLAGARAAERERIEVMARVAPAVCSVMPKGQPGGGSGVIFDPAGFVLTNMHVVGKTSVKEMVIGLPDGELYVADVLGVDPGSDLAVLLLRPKREGQTFPYARLGDSDRLLVGEQVFAMGNPFLLATDFQPTTTFGIVSGTHRYQPGGGNRMLVYPDCIQVDAPVNPGNSGGPLFNLDGEIVGINGRISVGDRGRVNVGVGFAIASNQIANFLPDLMTGKHAEHGTLDMNAWFMEAPGEKGRFGVFVQSVFEDSVVAEHGVKLGDEITRFNGIEVRSANQLATLVGVLPAGAEVTLGFRPKLDQGGFGEERIVRLRLSRLDTGSSRDPDRIADDAKRALAARTVAGWFRLEGDDPGGATVTLALGERSVTLHRLGDRLARTAGDARAVLETTAPPGGFAADGSSLSEETVTALARELATNPWLRSGEARRTMLDGALLDGGRMCAGKPAFGFRLPGAGERRVWFHRDGTPAGYGYRDPERKVYREVCVVEPARVLLYEDGKAIAEGDLRVDASPPAADTFAR